MGRFDGSVVLITGASAGIGAALARAFADEGADLALLARRTDRLEALAGELRARGRRALALACDVTQDGDLEAAAEAVRRELGAIDVVVANAGFGVVGKLAALTLEDYRRQFETNVFGVLRTVYATLEELERRRGRLVLIGSVAGYVSRPGGSPYAMSKFAVRALAKALGPELAPEGVSVTLISPGFIESEIRQIDNQGEHHPHARDGVPAWLLMSAERCARTIVDAAYARRPEAVITTHGKLLVLAERHAPRLLSAVMGAAAGFVKRTQSRPPKRR